MRNDGLMVGVMDEWCIEGMMNDLFKQLMRPLIHRLSEFVVGITTVRDCSQARCMRRSCAAG